jgi:hypothetical protein
MVAYDAARENEPDDPDAGESRQGKRCDGSRDPVRAPVARGIRIRNEHGNWCNPDAGGKENSRSVSARRAATPAAITPTIDAVTRIARERPRTQSLQ